MKPYTARLDTSMYWIKLQQQEVLHFEREGKFRYQFFYPNEQFLQKRVNVSLVMFINMS
jgi:hypothetical protein